MASPGYSGTALIQKLGIREDMKILLLHPPPSYFEWLGKDCSSQCVVDGEKPDFVHLFVQWKGDFEKDMKALEKLCKENPQLIIWVSWYKKSAGIPTDITEDIIRAYALQHGLVDIKVCAVSNEWSGLKLVVPKALRH